MTALVLLSDWMASQVEFWLPVSFTGFGHYDVSGFGNVRRGKRSLSVKPSPDGYVQIILTSDAGRRRNFKVHRLIAKAFLGSGEEINHRTAVKHDNRLDNLEWSTRLLNIRHSFEHGLVPRSNGERHPMAILTDAQAREIRDRVRAGERGVDLAREFGTTKYTVSDIKRGKTWKCLA